MEGEGVGDYRHRHLRGLLALLLALFLALFVIAVFSVILLFGNLMKTQGYVPQSVGGALLAPVLQFHRCAHDPFIENLHGFVDLILGQRRMLNRGSKFINSTFDPSVFVFRPAAVGNTVVIVRSRN